MAYLVTFGCASSHAFTSSPRKLECTVGVTSMKPQTCSCTSLRAFSHSLQVDDSTTLQSVAMMIRPTRRAIYGSIPIAPRCRCAVVAQLTTPSMSRNNTLRSLLHNSCFVQWQQSMSLLSLHVQCVVCFPSMFGILWCSYSDTDHYADQYNNSEKYYYLKHGKWRLDFLTTPPTNCHVHELSLTSFVRAWLHKKRDLVFIFCTRSINMK